jgi:signal transduction histidine kinase
VGLVTRPGWLPGAALASWVTWVWVPGFVALVVWLPLLFPDGRPPSPRWRPVAWSGWLTIALLLAAVLPAFDDRGPALLEGAVELPDWALRGAEMAGWGFRWIPWVALASLVPRYLGADRDTRIQIRWFVVASVSIGLAVADELVELPGWLLTLNAPPWVPAAIAVAVLRHRLYDIDVIVRRSIVYGGLLVGVVVVYVAVVGAVSALFGVDGLGPPLVATAVVAVAVQPARQRLESLAERVVYGGRRDPQAALSSLDSHLKGAVGNEDALAAICQAVVDASRAPWVRLELPDGSKAVAGKARGMDEAIPLEHRGEPVGRLLVGLDPGEQTLGRTTRRVIDELVPVLGATASTIALSSEVRRSREQLVTAREEERRRLRRDLHDGLGPSLAGITMEIQAARNLLDVDRVAASEMLSAAEGWAKDAISEVRRVVYGLRPPVLDQLGLVRALEEHAVALGSGQASGGLAVVVESRGDTAGLPAAAEVAAYLIALEALTNVARHARAQRCIVRIEAGDDLVVEVIDDGAGVGGLVRSGVGLTSMRERAEELGGALRIEDSDTSRGTRVRARIPIVR